jgi:hypothetical protein
MDRQPNIQPCFAKPFAMRNTFVFMQIFPRSQPMRKSNTSTDHFGFVNEQGLANAIL